MAGRESIVIHADVLHDGRSIRPDLFIVIEDNTITEVTPKKYPARFRGYVTPAFIDAHSHIGMERQGEPSSESEVNDETDQFTPLHDPLDSIYFDDRAFSEAVDFGVLYSCVVPGSGNILGGRARVIRNFVRNRDQALFHDYGYKMALGYNPRSTTKWDGIRPNTRMGIYALLEKYFDDVLRQEEKARLKRDLALLDLEAGREEGGISGRDIKHKKQLLKREYELELSREQWAVFRLLRGDKTVKVHVHKEDDALFLIELTRKYGIRVTADHCCDIFHTEIFNSLAAENIPIVYGPLGSLDYKVEIKHGFYQNAGLLLQSDANFGLMTDHPVILAHQLRESLKFFLIQGMSETEAISLITFRNARILGIEDRLGTLEKGKLASLIVWDRDPFYIGAFPLAVIAEGDIIREK